MAKILGLDLGTNSIGWAVVEDTQKTILGTGVRIFPEGVEAKTIGQGEREQSRNATRREARQMRRQYFRKRLRKAKLLEVLIGQNMCPLKMEGLLKWTRWDKIKKKEARKFPSSPEFIAWLKLNPYKFRNSALHGSLSTEKILLKTVDGIKEFEFTGKEIFGRILYHLIQRRGFLSSRKGKEDGKIYKGDPQKGMVGVDDTMVLVKENKTLGAALNKILPLEDKPYNLLNETKRARARYTLRDMYVKEFHSLWEKQSSTLGLNNIKTEQKIVRHLTGKLDSNRNKKKIAHLERLYGKENTKTESSDCIHKIITIKEVSLKELIGGTIYIENETVKFKSSESTLFYQRPLRSQKYLLGKCSLESRKFFDKKKNKWITAGSTPCPISHPAFEKKRAVEFINNIEYGAGQRLDENQVKTVLDLINSKDNTFKFSEIKKALNLSYERFNYEDNFKVSGSPSTANLKPLFNEEIWNKKFETETNENGKLVKKTEYGYERIWHCFYFYEDKEMLYEKLKKDFGLEEKHKDVILGKEKDGVRKDGIVLKDGYSNISLKATKNILYYLKKQDEKGNFYKQNEAILLAGVKNAFGKRWQYFESSWNEIEKQIIKINRQPNNKEGEAIVKIKKYFSDAENKFGFKENDPAFQRLYHHSQEIKEKKIQDKLSTAENLRNPIVQQGVNEMRRLVNLLIKEHGKFDAIKIELGRNLKNSKTKRQELTQAIDENREKNDEARAKLTEYGLRHSRENIQKYLLYKEIGMLSGEAICPYSGRHLNISDTLSENNIIQIEHIIPKSISLDDGFANKTLCDSKFNGLKGEKTPYQFYKINNDEKLWGVKSWEEVKQRAFRLLPYKKAKRFTSETDFKVDKFIERQKNDMRYMSRKAKEMLSEICENVHALPGGLTAELRHLWGTNNILQPLENISLTDFEVETDKVYPFYLVVDESGKQISLQNIYNTKPRIKENQTMLAGKIDNKRIFTSSEKYVLYREELKKEENGADELKEGEYWRMLNLSSPKELARVFIDKPQTGESKIVLRGKIEKGKFKHDSIGSLSAANINDGIYWASISIKERKFEKSSKNKEPEKKGKDMLLYGQVNNSVFKSYIYECKAEMEDEKYWLLLTLNFNDVKFEKAINERPESKSNQIMIQGVINGDGLFTSDIDYEHQFKTNEKPGKYWALFDIISNGKEFFRIKNNPPEVKIKEGQKLIEGNIWVDKYTGEIKFDPKKNREDQRHHALDAIVIALSEQSYFQQLSNYYAYRKDKERGIFDKEQLNFSVPWNNFHISAKEAAEKILISYKQNNKVLTEIKKKITKNGKAFPSEGMAVRSQLHNKFFYGKNKFCAENEYLKREKVKELGVLDLRNIVDEKVKRRIIEILLTSTAIIKDKSEKEKQVQLSDNEKVIFNKLLKEEKLSESEKKNEKEIKKKISEMLSAINFFMPNEGKRYQRLKKKSNEERKPVPIKKVRIKRVFSNARFIKETQGLHIFKSSTNNYNQYVDPGNNHHVAIYKNSSEELIEKVISFWDAVERVRQGMDAIDKNPTDATEFVESLQKNEMFFLKGLYEKDRNSKIIPDIEMDEADDTTLSKYLYRCEAISSKYYEFRHHLESTHNREYRPHYIRIQNLGEGVTGWLTYKPIKVNVSPTGKISK